MSRRRDGAGPRLRLGGHAGDRDRPQEACTGEVAAIAARTFGGPQAAFLAGADAPTLTCLSTASSVALRLVNREAKLRAA